MFLSEVSRRSFCIIFSGLIGHLHISLNARKKVSKTEARQKIDFGKSAGPPEPEAARIVSTFFIPFQVMAVSVSSTYFSNTIYPFIYARIGVWHG